MAVVSGCSQASRWMSRNEVDHPTALAEVSTNSDNAAEAEFDAVFEEIPTERSQFIPAGFTQDINSTPGGQHADSTARPMVPPADADRQTQLCSM